MLARLGALVIGVHAVLPGAVAFATDEQEKTVETVTVAETVTAVETVTEPAPEAPAQAAELTDTLAQATEETQTPVLSAPEQSVEETVSVQTPEEDTAVQTNAPVTTDGATTELTPATEELTPESIQAPQPAEVSNAEAIPTQAQDTVQAPLADESQTTIITKEEKKADRPSMIADRSDEGQPLTQGTTFRGGKKDPVKFYNSKDEIFPANAKYGIVLTSDESKVDIEETKKLYQSFGDFVESEVSKLGKYEILEIDGKKFLFEGKNK